MERGLYELVMTEALKSLAPLRHGETVLEFEDGGVDPADQPHVLAAHVARALERALRGTRDETVRADLVNDLLARISDGESPVTNPISRLLRVDEPPGPGSRRLPDIRPVTPLGEAALLTNAHDEPGLGWELRAEIDSSDRVDLLCAFVKWYGLRLLDDELRRLRERGGRLRVLTTTYLGSTDRRALDRLVRDHGAEVRVQYDPQRTRLHAKAWLFHRLTGFDTAYVGSSNLSRAALLDGVEWNVRLSRTGTPSLLEKFAATFETYWESDDYEVYDPDVDGERLDRALDVARGGGSHDRQTLQLSGLEVSALPHQSRMLEELEAERLVHDRHRNLIVAATGTGKTVLAALDYRRIIEAGGGIRPRLLFVAHRKEILEQARRTYREVLSDGSFGELLVDGAQPSDWRFVFASVQSLNARSIADVPADAFDVVVIDEFHHAAAASYRLLLEHLTPHELLGLTATPERADGIDVRSLFGGRIASELRLWDALGADLLCPFHYFVIADHVDLDQVRWTAGGYDVHDLERLYAGNTARADLVLRELLDKVPDVSRMRALGYCVSVAHARFMTERFAAAGIASKTVTGQTTRVERETALAELRAGTVNVLFTVDLFNEGLDIPDIDTVMFLRPTESATVFLQQLGRGLRRTASKPVLTALDFVGHQHRKFRFDRKLRALTGATRRELERDVSRGFPFLPPGCQIQLDRETQEIVLANIRGQLTQRWSQVVAELRAVVDAKGDSSLRTFLDESGLELADVVRRAGQRSWTRARREAHLPARLGTPGEAELLRRVQAFAHVEDRPRRAAYQRLLSDAAPSYTAMTAGERRYARMLFFSFFANAGGHATYDAGLAAIRAEPAVRDEIRSVIDVVFDEGRVVTSPLTGDLEDVPLAVHARYQREEILAALDYASLERTPRSVMQGVAYSPARNADIFFITLKKSEADFSPTTMYRDYPISRTLFHWESQSTTSVASPTGQRYVSGSSHVLLFVRLEEKGDFDTSPYTFLGPATYVAHEGERPIALTWRLERAMPTEFFEAASVAAS